jgi:hypothetical protein
MPILEGFNPFDWDQRVRHILEKESKPIFELEPVQMQIGIITIITDEKGLIHVFKGRHTKVTIGGFTPHSDHVRIKELIDRTDRELRRRYKIVKIDAFLPFWLLKRLYLPDYWKPYKKSRKKRII